MTKTFFHNMREQMIPDKNVLNNLYLKVENNGPALSSQINNGRPRKHRTHAKRLAFVAVAAIIFAGTFALFSLGKDSEKELEPTAITLTQTEIDHYKDFIYQAHIVESYFKGNTLLEIGFSEWYDDPIEAQEAYKRFEEATGIDYNDNRYYPVDPRAPYQAFGELKAVLSKYFSADAAEQLLAEELYIEHNGKLYVSPRDGGTLSDYSRVMISPDATISKWGTKTIFATVPPEEWVTGDRVPTLKIKVVFVTEDGTEKIDEMYAYDIQYDSLVSDSHVSGSHVSDSHVSDSHVSDSHVSGSHVSDYSLVSDVM